MDILADFVFAHLVYTWCTNMGYVMYYGHTNMGYVIYSIQEDVIKNINMGYKNKKSTLYNKM